MWCKCLGGGDSSGLTHTHTFIQPAWYFLNSIRLIAPKKSRANVWSAPHAAAAQHQEQWDTSVHIKNQETKQKTIKHIIAAHSSPFQTEPRQNRRSRNSQGCDKLCCQIQQLKSVHDDADWRKCLAFLCKHWGSLKNFAHLFSLRWSSKTMSKTLWVCRPVYF